MLGDRLKKARLDCGLTQQQVADLLGIDRSSYTYYETGKSNVSTQTLKLLAVIFGISFDWLAHEEHQNLEFHSFSRFKPFSFDDDPFTMPMLSNEERQFMGRYRIIKYMGKEDELDKILKDMIADILPVPEGEIKNE